jgi:hypothetical protein
VALYNANGSFGLVFIVKKDNNENDKYAVKLIFGEE